MEESKPISQSKTFWFNFIGALLTVLEVFTNVLKDNLLIYWSFHNCLSIIEHIIILIGLYYDLKSKERLSAPA